MDGVAPLNITLLDPKCLLHFSTTLCSAYLEVLIQKGGMILRGDTTIPLN